MLIAVYQTVTQINDFLNKYISYLEYCTIIVLNFKISKPKITTFVASKISK